MEILDYLKRNNPCGRITGHGESCHEGMECEACSAKNLAYDEIVLLRQKVVERDAVIAKKDEVFNDIKNIEPSRALQNMCNQGLALTTESNVLEKIGTLTVKEDGTWNLNVNFDENGLFVGLPPKDFLLYRLKDKS